MIKPIESGALKKAELGQDIFNAADDASFKKTEFAGSIFDSTKETIKDGVETKKATAQTLEEKVTPEKTWLFGGFVSAVKNFFTQGIKDKDGNDTGFTPADVALSAVSPIYGAAKVIGNFLDCES